MPFIYKKDRMCITCGCIGASFYTRKVIGMLKKHVTKYCITCYRKKLRIYNKKYYKKNKKELSLANKNFRYKNKELYNKRARKYYKKRRIEALDQKKIYYQKKKELRKENRIRSILNRDRIRQREVFKTNNMYLLETL